MGQAKTYHGAGGEFADLLDGARCALLELYSVDLMCAEKKSVNQSSVQNACRKIFEGCVTSERLKGGQASHSGGLHKTDYFLFSFLLFLFFPIGFYMLGVLWFWFVRGRDLCSQGAATA